MMVSDGVDYLTILGGRFPGLAIFTMAVGANLSGTVSGTFWIPSLENNFRRNVE